jgi:hypothetical protein
MLVNLLFEQLFMFKKEIIPMNNSMKYMYSSPFLLKLNNGNQCIDNIAILNYKPSIVV